MDRGGEKAGTRRQNPGAHRQAAAGGASALGGAPGPGLPALSQTMVVRVARSGRNAGGDFWGCADYPKCRGIRPIFSAAARSK